MVITEATNFLRVFRLPDKFSSAFCFGGGISTEFTMVDWFNAHNQQYFWKNEEIEVGEEKRTEIIEFVKLKTYFKREHTYLVITDYGDAFIINPELKYNQLNAELKAIKEQAL